MTFINATLATTAALLIASSAAAFEAPTSLDLTGARIDASQDINSDGTVTDDEIITANAAFFDCDDDGQLSAYERFQAADVLAQNAGLIERIDLVDRTVAEMMPMSLLTFDAQSARMNVAFDSDRDWNVSNEELILANVSDFDLDGDGQINALERLTAKEYLIRM